MSDGKNSFILYHDQREVFNRLSKEQAGELIQAIFDYEVTGEMPELSDPLPLVIIPIKQAIDRNKEKYENIVNKRKEAGSKGGKQKQANLANASFDVANLAKPSDSVNVPVPENVNETEIPKKKIQKEKGESPNSEYSEEFETAWGYYPNRLGTNSKKAAWQKWQQAIKKYSPQLIINGIIGYQKFCDVTGKLNTEFVKLAETFINKEDFLTNWEEQCNAAREAKANEPITAGTYEYGGIYSKPPPCEDNSELDT